VVGMADPKPQTPAPERDPGGDLLNKIIVIIIALMLVGFGAPLTLRAGDTILAAFAGAPLTLATLFLLAAGMGLIFVGAGLIWRVARSGSKKS
jgi:hypothetical protein